MFTNLYVKVFDCLHRYLWLVEGRDSYLSFSLLLKLLVFFLVFRAHIRSSIRSRSCWRCGWLSERQTSAHAANVKLSSAFSSVVWRILKRWWWPNARPGMFFFVVAWLVGWCLLFGRRCHNQIYVIFSDFYK